jgi:2-keto-3-deoxy-L-rhamnonate aldolase RhmA
MRDRPHVDPARFRERLLAGELLLGTFLRTPAAVHVEILAEAPIDLVCIDGEHAPFGPAELDACLAVARAVGLPTLVRIPVASQEHVSRALDLGASGILVPHVSSVSDAEDVVRMTRYWPGSRGYAGTTRAAGFMTGQLEDNVAAAAERTTVVVQLEDLAGIDAAGDIASVEGVDAVLIGPSDLAVAMGAARVDDPRVVEAVSRAIAATRAAGGIAGAFAGSPAVMRSMRDQGVTLLTAGSDQASVLDGARRLRDVLSQG